MAMCKGETMNQNNIKQDEINRKCTLYTTGGMFGVQKYEITLKEYGLILEYAQYKNVPYIKGIIKGKRLIQHFSKAYKPFMLLVDGWNQPDTLDPFTHEKSDNFYVSKSKYSCFDDRYLIDFNNYINPLIDNNTLKVIVDYRFKEVV